MQSPNGKRTLGSSAERHPTRRKFARKPKKRADRPKISIREMLIVLRKMEKGSGTINALELAAGVSRATIYRILADCKDELGVRFSRYNGTYAIIDWGLLSRRRVLG